MKKRILIQLDCDPNPSTFDAVVAIDSGVDHLLQYGSVQATNLTTLVHGAMFTRGGDDLSRTAIFIGGSDVDNAETLMNACSGAFFGPVRVSLMMDANGCNTTSAAAVVAASRHTPLAGTTAVVLGGTGPVGRRVSQLLALDGADVRLSSRSLRRAERVCKGIRSKYDHAKVTAAEISNHEQLDNALDGASIVIACGAAGIELVDRATMEKIESLRVAIDLNAVPPAGIGGIAATDKGTDYGHGVAYGALGVGGLKMKTHKQAVDSLFERNDLVLDAEQIYEIAKAIG